MVFDAGDRETACATLVSGALKLSRIDADGVERTVAIVHAGGFLARLFVAVYSTRMHGGFLRFQAQYLRRIRVPHWRDVPDDAKRALVEAAERGDRAACNSAVFKLYGLTAAERAALGGNKD